jgi:hypothetical protein
MTDFDRNPRATSGSRGAPSRRSGQARPESNGWGSSSADGPGWGTSANDNENPSNGWSNEPGALGEQASSSQRDTQARVGILWDGDPLATGGGPLATGLGLLATGGDPLETGWSLLAMRGVPLGTGWSLPVTGGDLLATSWDLVAGGGPLLRGGLLEPIRDLVGEKPRFRIRAAGHFQQQLLRK